ncbi:general secretion pathway protein F [Azoarcus olearius]|uniref:type II secretion system F family protein n=1 Tax=Azoarcus sp. (strain BH72) TaxID=418699 RepID=UPI0008061DAA|nr:type II secretion system F family protein [Azoarcus olearius]ANQ83940.1 general secretion pathway protein F [Azoarcus olearius]
MSRLQAHAYRAVNGDGRRVRGRAHALHLNDLEARLATRGLTLIHGEVARRSLRPQPRLPARELGAFCAQLAHLLEAGIPLVEALRDLGEGNATPAARPWDDIATALEGGDTLSDACAARADLFDEVFVSLLRAGEQAGRLPAVLHHLAATLERSAQVAAHLRRMSIYPTFVLAVLAVAAGTALVFVVPQLSSLFRSLGETLPWQTRALLSLSDLVLRHGAWATVVAVLCLAGVRLALLRSIAFRLQVHAALLRLPVVGGLWHTALLARVCQVLAVSYEAGVPIVAAVTTAAGTAGNLVVRTGLEQVADDIAAGADLSGALASTRVFPPRVTRMLRVGEHSGTLDRALRHAGAFYERELQEGVARLQAAVEPALTVLLGLLMLWIMSAILGPIYDVLGKLPL